ncbi:MAG: hypothetical protein V1928_05745, partial [Parcubacteria group bacterium]
DILIEDDCQSIGAEEIIAPKLDTELKIHSIIVPEFGGIDQLPDRLDDLKEYGKELMRNQSGTDAED